MYLQILMLILLGVPSLWLFYNGCRMVFKFERIRHLGLTIFNIWIVAVVFLAFFVLSTARNYRMKEEKRMEISFEKQNADTLCLTLRAEDPEMKFLEDEKYAFFNDMKVVIADDKELLLVPRIRIEESDDSLFSVSQVLQARGQTTAEARQNLALLRYQVSSRGSTLMIGPYARLPKGDCWRGQDADLIIKVPKGKFVRVDKDLEKLKPNWIWFMIPDKGKVLRMTDSGLEEAENINDTIISR